MLLYQLLKKTKKGHYIDIGAHHPIRSSISYYFYLRGWEGICVEPNPTFIPDWSTYRKRDFLISKGVGSEKGFLEYFKLKDSERNTFSEEYLRAFNLHDQVVSSSKIQIISLKDVFDFFKNGEKVSFLNIDCEGFELDILKSNDWEIFRPEYIVLESHNYIIDEDMVSEEYQYLISNKYLFIGKTMQGEHVGNLIFRNELIK